MAKRKKSRSRRRHRSPSTKAKKAYGNLLLRAYKRFQPGGKAYKALKSHGRI